MMIEKYTDHSANERTYLAWIRTALGIMAFGFLIEKFDLYAAYIIESIGVDNQFDPSFSAEMVGLGLFVVGVLIIVSATLRYFILERSIESDATIPYSIKKTNIILSVLLISLAVFLMVYLSHRIFN